MTSPVSFHCPRAKSFVVSALVEPSNGDISRTTSSTINLAKSARAIAANIDPGPSHARKPPPS